MSDGAVNRSRPLKDADKFRSDRRRRHQSLTTVDVESAVLRLCQSPAYGPVKSGDVLPASDDETQGESPSKLSPSIGPISKDFCLVSRVSSAAAATPTASPASSTTTSSPVSTSPAAVAKRTESAPDLGEIAASRPRIIIRLTSVDGLELNLTSPRSLDQDTDQDNSSLLLHPPPPRSPIAPVRTVRCGAARPPQELVPSK